MEKLKLSKLDDYVQIANEYGVRNYTVAEIKNEIVRYREPHHDVRGEWFVVNPAKWKPSAHDFLEYYIESVYQDMYEDWDNRAWNCVTDEVVNKIQAILDETLDEATTDYWEFDFNKPVEIDIRPHKE